jgi:S-adenosylmethionine hydrolase
MARLIALLTDFGTTDPYVGVMKGVIYSICPDALIVDVTHAIAPQNIRQAAFMLLTSYRYFPSDTIFVVVVDPGVGSARKPIAVQIDGYTFIAPDNGVLSYVIAENLSVNVYEIQNPAFMLPNLSASFHGRDIFAPTAGRIATGKHIEEVSVAIKSPQQINMPMLNIEAKRIIGEIIHVDHFGNLVTSIGRLQHMDSLTAILNPRFGVGEMLYIDTVSVRVSIVGVKVRGIKRTYSQASQDELLTMIGSSGFLEIAVNQGHAAAVLGATIGDRVEVELG